MALGREMSKETIPDVMDELLLFQLTQKAKAFTPAGTKLPSLILTDSTGNRRLSVANFNEVQEIIEQKHAIEEAEEEASLGSAEYMERAITPTPVLSGEGT